ncbi:hypothetical protein RIR_jg28236.t1 [Rhizophagus irregularis DAOM 181602=DAOM 197198]|nr:hypothetical protein RIR_jg28236.t1 [Rhizophagus irregularis DAOM 181602=DAOM 197198]
MIYPTHILHILGDACLELNFGLGYKGDALPDLDFIKVTSFLTWISAWAIKVTPFLTWISAWAIKVTPFLDLDFGLGY